MDRKVLTKEQISRIARYGRRAWKLLTQEERDAYTNEVGTLKFLSRLLLYFE